MLHKAGMSTKDRQPCRFYAQGEGKCRFGARCRFLHENVKDTEVVASASSGTADTSQHTLQWHPPILNQLFVAGLRPSVNDAYLKAYFEAFGSVNHAFVVKEAHDSNQSRGFGFVSFAEKKDYQVALEATHKMMGKPVTVKPATKTRNPPRAIYAGIVPRLYAYKESKADRNKVKRAALEGLEQLERLKWKRAGLDECDIDRGMQGWKAAQKGGDKYMTADGLRLPRPVQVQPPREVIVKKETERLDVFMQRSFQVLLPSALVRMVSTFLESHGICNFCGLVHETSSERCCTCGDCNEYHMISTCVGCHEGECSDCRESFSWACNRCSTMLHWRCVKHLTDGVCPHCVGRDSSEDDSDEWNSEEESEWNSEEDDSDADSDLSGGCDVCGCHCDCEEDELVSEMAMNFFAMELGFAVEAMLRDERK